MKDLVSSKDVSRWLAAWAVDQLSVGGDSPVYNARSDALADAARQILHDDVTDLRGFVQANGRYPEKSAA
jgi:hypothetical protein